MRFFALLRMTELVVFMLLQEAPMIRYIFSEKRTGWFATIMLKGCGNITYAPIAQLDRASDYESAGRGFKSSWARQLFLSLTKNFPSPQADAGAILNRFVRVNNN
jgi:hypothetical protein